MTFVPFDLERWQSTWENRVKFNISESGVHPLSIRELLDLASADLDEFAALRMIYSQANGTDELRQAIAGLYPGADPEQILVTVGSAEANFITCWSLIRPGDKIVILAPTYWQTWGLSKNFGANVQPIWCEMDRGWEPSLDEIQRAITPGTRLVVVTNPGNPTGHVLSNEARAAILDRTKSAGAWLLCDEVYQGAERNGDTTQSFWGSYDKLVIVNGLSKAYGLPGLRIGWIVAPRQFIGDLWAHQDYTVIGPSPASDFLARCAIKARLKILERTRGILKANFPVVDAWLKSFDGFFEWLPSEAGAICCVRYRGGPGTLDLVEQIRAGQSVLLVPGEHFGLPSGYLRLGFGNERPELEKALAQTKAGLKAAIRD